MSKKNNALEYHRRWKLLFWLTLCSPIRLTDPVPTTETSIAPRQRPKAGQTQPQPISGILPIQPALTPRKRPNVAAGAPQAIGKSNYVTQLSLST